MSRRLSGYAAPGRPAVWTALNFLPSASPPPISNTIWRRVRPIGTSISPVLATAPVRANTLVPLDLRPYRAQPSPPRVIDRRDIGERLDVVDQVGQPQSPDAAGRRAGLRRAPAPQDRRDESRLFPAHECAGADAHLDLEAEPGTGYVRPEVPGRSAWRMALDRRLTARGYSARTYT